MVRAAVLPMTPDGMPVRGGEGAMTVPFGVLRGFEIWCGGANAMPTAKMLSKPGAMYVLGQSSAFHCSYGFAV